MYEIEAQNRLFKDRRTVERTTRTTPVENSGRPACLIRKTTNSDLTLEQAVVTDGREDLVVSS